MIQGFKNAFGSFFGFIIACFVFFIIVYAISNASKTINNTNVDTSNLVYKEILSEQGNGKNTTQTFNLLGNDPKLTFSFSGNETCILETCSPGYTGLSIKCSDNIFSELLINQGLKEINKTYNIADQKGECTVDVDLKEGVSWSLKVEEKR